MRWSIGTGPAGKGLPGWCVLGWDPTLILGPGESSLPSWLSQAGLGSLGSLQEFRTPLLSFAPRHSQGCGQGHTTKSPTPKRYIYQKITNFITVGMGSGFPSYLCPAPGPWLWQQSLDLLWNGDPSSPHTEPGTQNRAQPTAQTHKARSSLPPVTSPRSVGQSWPLPSPQEVSQGPSATQGHPKPVVPSTAP